MECRLQELRQVLGWSQEQLAFRAGVSVSLVRKLERKTSVAPAIPTGRKLATALGVTLDDIWPPTTTPDEAPAAQVR